MSYLNRVWMAAGVAVVQGHIHGDRSPRWNAGKGRVTPAGLVPTTGFGFGRSQLGDGSGEERRQQADDSLHKAMYISCWGPS
ncbi:hypothetical protein COCNU_14G006740 [Cocos nucifera]|uniref:Uncharacterized protein n=1 Tax=Cocos nucifera TaxID=13894 RepID=A0A8K0IV28_COCNU|nr:hypothetical protein COCNU_14G006740 [Cocos nucifera]